MFEKKDQNAAKSVVKHEFPTKMKCQLSGIICSVLFFFGGVLLPKTIYFWANQTNKV